MDKFGVKVRNSADCGIIVVAIDDKAGSKKISEKVELVLHKLKDGTALFLHLGTQSVGEFSIHTKKIITVTGKVTQQLECKFPTLP